MIYTFYSYKGGVGRSMALANVAQLCYEAGLRVIVVDWDLEAPGLERFFFEDVETVLGRPGVIDILLAYKNSVGIGADLSNLLLPEPKDYLIKVTSKLDSRAELSLLTAGSRTGDRFSEYAQSILSFDWYDFYQNWEGEGFIEWLRLRLEALADVILIDSRTGLTEVSGACTYQLADTIVMFCAPNRQNIEGTLSMARSFQSISGSPMRRERKLEVIVVPSRVDNYDSGPVNQFKKEFQQTFKDKAIGKWELNIPYTPRLAFKETVAYQTKEQVQASDENYVRAVESLSRELAYLHNRQTVGGQILTFLDATTLSLSLPPRGQLPEPGPLPRGSRVVFSRNPLFVGREEELLKVAELLLHESSQTAFIVATGMGGVGKTQLAVEFAYRYGRFFHTVHWVNMGDASAVPFEIAACGAAMGLHPDFDTLPIDARVQLINRVWHGPEPRLVIFDNCDDPELLNHWRPGAGGVRLLVTSRNQVWSAGLSTWPISTLAREDSITLLSEYLRSAEPPRQESMQELSAVASELGDLPLALSLAGSYLAAYPGVTLNRYLDELRRSDSLAHPSLEGRGQPQVWTGHKLSVGRTFGLGFEKLRPIVAEDEAAIMMLAGASLLAPGEPFPRKLVTEMLPGDDPYLPDDALRRLLTLGLFQRAEGSWLQLHRLIVAFAHEAVADRLAEAQALMERTVIDLAHQQNVYGDPRALREWDIHLHHVTDTARDREDETAATLCNEFGYYLWISGDLTGAKPYLERALAVRERVLGPEHPDTAGSLNNLGLLLQDIGDLAGARPYYERALAVYERVLGLEHPYTATSLNNLGSLLQAMGDLAGARPYYERALAVRERVLGPEHPDTAASLNNVGMLLMSVGDVVGAQPYLERALAVCERVLGPEHPDTATSLDNLGFLLQAMGDLPAARPYNERALAIWERVLGPEHPNTARSLNNLGSLLYAMGDKVAARPYFERALTITTSVLGPEHPATATSLNNLGRLLQAMGDLSTARSHLEHALAIRERVLGPEHPDTAGSLNNLGLLMQAIGDLPAARSHLERAVNIYEHILGPEHPSTIATSESLTALGSIGEEGALPFTHALSAADDTADDPI